MTPWVRLDVAYFTHPKAIAAGLGGRALHLASICWAHEHLSDGRVPVEVVPMLCSIAGVPRRTADRLVEVGLWERNGTGFEIHGYAERNQSRVDVEAGRASWRERQRRYRERRAEEET